MWNFLRHAWRRRSGDTMLSFSNAPPPPAGLLTNFHRQLQQGDMANGPFVVCFQHSHCFNVKHEYCWTFHGFWLRKEPRIKVVDRSLFFLPKRISLAAVDELKKYWPNYHTYGDINGYRSFWLYEWSKHAQYLGIGPYRFMDIAVEMRKRLPNDFGVKAGKMYTVRETRQIIETVIGARVQINGAVYNGSVVIDGIRRHKPLVMTEIRVLMAKTFELMEYDPPKHPQKIGFSP